MKAAFLIAPQTFELRDVASPVAPPGGIVLDVKACGVCGSDLRRWKEGPAKGSTEIIPGHEAAGVVCQVGPNAEGYSVGDRIAIAPDIHCGKCWYCRRGLYNICDDMGMIGITPDYPGAFAETVVLPAKVLVDGIVHKAPESLPFAHAAIAEPCCSVLACHRNLATGLGDIVLVMGAGPIGCLHIAVAMSRGAEVIVSEPNSTRRQLAERFCPFSIVDPANEDLAECVRAATAGLGADAVICANPIAATQTQAVELVRKGGTVVLFGGLPKANPTVTLDSNRIHYGEIKVVGSFSYHPTVHGTALKLLADGSIPADLLITHKFPLDDIDAAYHAAASGEALKVVVTIE
jgi:L-iditol 2-dehydrogenase